MNVAGIRGYGRHHNHRTARVPLSLCVNYAGYNRSALLIIYPTLRIKRGVV